MQRVTQSKMSLYKGFLLLIILLGSSAIYGQEGLFDSTDPMKEPYSVPGNEIEARINSSASASGINMAVNPKDSELWVDIKSVPGNTSAAAVMRVIMMIGRLTEPTYDVLVFSDQGEKIFIISGEDIRAIGRQFVWGEEGKGQNPIVLLRRFVDGLRYPDGERVAPRFNGSLLGDTSKTMKTIADKFHPEWTFKTIEIK